MSAYSTLKASLSPTAWWRFGDASGTVAAEVSGTYAATYVGSPTLAVTGAIAGDTDTAVAFNGTSQYAKRLGLTPPSSQMTCEAWVYATARTTWASIIKCWTDSGSGAAVHLGLESTTGELSVYMTQSNGTDIGPVKSPSALTTGAWHHVASVADGSFLRLYLDGASVGTPVAYNGTIRTSITSWGIGVRLVADGSAANVTSPGYWNGSIDEPAVYPTGLSAAQVLALYNAGLTSGIPGGVLAALQEMGVI